MTVFDPPAETERKRIDRDSSFESGEPKRPFDPPDDPNEIPVYDPDTENETTKEKGKEKDKTEP